MNISIPISSHLGLLIALILLFLFHLGALFYRLLLVLFRLCLWLRGKGQFRLLGRGFRCIRLTEKLSARAKSNKSISFQNFLLGRKAAINNGGFLGVRDMPVAWAKSRQMCTQMRQVFPYPNVFWRGLTYPSVACLVPCLGAIVAIVMAGVAQVVKQEQVKR